MISCVFTCRFKFHTPSPWSRFVFATRSSVCTNNKSSLMYIRIVFESNCNVGNTVLPSRLLRGTSKVLSRYSYTRVIRTKHVCVFFGQNAVVKPGFPKNSWWVSYVVHGSWLVVPRRSSFLRELYAYDSVRTSRENSMRSRALDSSV